MKVSKEKLDKLDKIYLNRNDLEKIMEWDRINHEKFDSLAFPLNEGVILLEEYSDLIGHKVVSGTYFKLNEKGIEFVQFDDADNEVVLSFIADDNYFNSNEFTDLKSNLERATKEMMQETAKMTLYITCCIMQYIANFPNQVVENKQIKNIKKKQGRKQGKQLKSKFIKISTSKYSFNFIDDVEKRCYTKPNHSYVVRGHWRVIKKTGKRIWVKPYVKGEGDINPKNYKI